MKKILTTLILMLLSAALTVSCAKIGPARQTDGGSLTAKTPEITGAAPTEDLTIAPTQTPSPALTQTPSPAPTEAPTPQHADTPAPVPADTPTTEPTEEPAPVSAQTPAPTAAPPLPAEVPPTPYATPPDGSTFDIVINIAGDCMLASYKNEDSDNGFKEHALREDPKYFLEKVAHIFKADDLTIVNLECVLTDRDLPPLEKNEATPYWYYGRTSNTRMLTEQGVEAVSLANNHMYDYKDEGLIDTVEAVKNAGLLYAGWEETFYYEKNGFKIAVICANLYVGGEADVICGLVKEASKVSDFQIVFFHGGKMRLHEPEQWKTEACRRIVDAGADLIVGAHPHVLQPREVYNGVDIVYSLGNFCYGGSRRPENRTVIYHSTLTVGVNDGKLVSANSYLIPCYVYTGEVNNFQPAPITDGAEYKKVIDFMNGLTDSPL